MKSWIVKIVKWHLKLRWHFQNVASEFCFGKLNIMKKGISYNGPHNFNLIQMSLTNQDDTSVTPFWFPFYFSCHFIIFAYLYYSSLILEKLQTTMCTMWPSPWYFKKGKVIKPEHPPPEPLRHHFCILSINKSGGTKQRSWSNQWQSGSLEPISLNHGQNCWHSD